MTITAVFTAKMRPISRSLTWDWSRANCGSRLNSE